jgi:hypothetical protein
MVVYRTANRVKYVASKLTSLQRRQIQAFNAIEKKFSQFFILPLIFKAPVATNTSSSLSTLRIMKRTVENEILRYSVSQSVCLYLSILWKNLKVEWGTWPLNELRNTAFCLTLRETVSQCSAHYGQI